MVTISFALFISPTHMIPIYMLQVHGGKYNNANVYMIEYTLIVCYTESKEINIMEIEILEKYRILGTHMNYILEEKGLGKKGKVKGKTTWTFVGAFSNIGHITTRIKNKELQCSDVKTKEEAIDFLEKLNFELCRASMELAL